MIGAGVPIPKKYTVFNVKDPDETFNEDSIRIAIIELTETSLQLSEIQEGEEEVSP